MTPEVKNRIEQIRHGNVPDGYKHSAAGIIPEDWEIHTASEHLVESYIPGSTGDVAKKITVKLWNKGVVEKKEVHIGSENTKYYRRKTGQFIYSKLDFLNCAFGIIPKELNGYESTLDLPAFDINDIEPFYLLSQVTQRRFYERWGVMAANGGRKARRISPEDFLAFPITVPCMEEQTKIAEILTAQDKVIELKEKRLVEKQRQKKYLMQQLLTGKKRLPGFDGEWKKTPLKTLLKERKTYSPKGTEYPHVTLSTEGIYAKSDRYDRDHLVKDEETEYKITLKGDICYNPANLKFGVICINNFGDAIFSPIYVTFEVVGNVSSSFLSNYLMRWDFINAVRKYEEGTVYERMAVKPEDFLKFEMMLPPYDEQVAIAEILSVADREIELLRQNLEQEKQKKKVLMQLLLTVVVRVQQ